MTHTPVGRRRLLHLHVVVDDPGLATDLGDDPAGLERDDRRDAGTRPPATGTASSSGCRAGTATTSAYHAASRNSSVAMPTMTSHARCTTFTSPSVGRWLAGTRVEALHHGGRPGARIGQPRRQARDREAADHLPLRVQVTEDASRARRSTSWARARWRRTSPARCCRPTAASSSPTNIWIGAAIAATVNGMMKPSR